MGRAARASPGNCSTMLAEFRESRRRTRILLRSVVKYRVFLSRSSEGATAGAVVTANRTKDAGLAKTCFHRPAWERRAFHWPDICAASTERASGEDAAGGGPAASPDACQDCNRMLRRLLPLLQFFFGATWPDTTRSRSGEKWLHPAIRGFSARTIPCGKGSQGRLKRVRTSMRAAARISPTLRSTARSRG